MSYLMVVHVKPVTHDTTSWLKTVGCNKLVGKSCHVSPYVATNFFKSTLHKTSQIQIVSLCVTGFSMNNQNN